MRGVPVTVKSNWHWVEHPGQLAILCALHDLPIFPNAEARQHKVHVGLASPLAGGRRRLSFQAASGEELAGLLAENGVTEEQVASCSSGAPVPAYLNEPENPRFFYPAAPAGSVYISGNVTSLTWNADFPEAFYLDWHPPWQMPPGVLEQYRRDYVPQNQAFLVTQACALIKHLRPDCVTAAQENAERSQVAVWTGERLHMACPPDELVLVYVRNGVPVEGLPGFLEPVAFLDGWLLWNPRIFACDIPALTARVSDSGFVYNREWDMVRRART